MSPSPLMKNLTDILLRSGVILPPENTLTSTTTDAEKLEAARFALIMLREHHGRNTYDSSVVMAVYQWIDNGMVGRVPFPTSPFFAKWAQEHGWRNDYGFVAFTRHDQ